MHTHRKCQRKHQWWCGSLLLIAFAFLAASCSSGGSSSGTGSSTVEGNVSSFSVAMAQPHANNGFSFAAVLQWLLPATDAYAATSVENIQVQMEQMHTTTDAGGNFRFDGVAPGTHQMQFSRDNQMATMSIEVGDDETVTMMNVHIQGQMAHADSVNHQRHGGMGSGGSGGGNGGGGGM